MKSLKNFDWQRLITQIVFLILAPQTFSLAFAGVKALFAAVGAGQVFQANSFLFLMLFLVVFTIIFGRFFCGYACAFGTIGDLVYLIVDLPFRKLHKKHPTLPAGICRFMRFFKYVVLVFCLVTAVIDAASFFGVYSPWTAFGRLLALNITDLNVIGLALLVLIVIGSAFKERFFCEFFCPMGAVFSLLPQLPFSVRRRQMNTCNTCGACQRVCPVDIMPSGEKGVYGECIDCGRCEKACPKGCLAQSTAAKLEAAFAEDASKPAQKSSRNRLVRCIVLAVILLVAFWLFGALNFLPASPLA